MGILEIKKNPGNFDGRFFSVYDIHRKKYHASTLCLNVASRKIVAKRKNSEYEKNPYPFPFG